MAGESKTTTDHEEIRRWVEERGGHPATVKNTAEDGEPGLLRIDFPGYSGGQSLEEISWDEFFQKFDEKNLAFLYQEETADGEESRFVKLISRETSAGESGAVMQEPSKRQQAPKARPQARAKSKSKPAAKAKTRPAARASAPGKAAQAKKKTSSKKAAGTAKRSAARAKSSAPKKQASKSNAKSKSKVTRSKSSKNAKKRR
jgi:hypothetical protein